MMNYKIVIADDDELLLKGLSTVFDWETLGIKVVASVDDGDKALIAMEEYNADILLTDIKMTNMDGLTLTERVKEYNSKVSVVVMSAYDEFAYAQKAIRMNVEDYLVKPIDLEILTDRMKQIVKKIAEKENQEEQVEKLTIKNRIDLQETFYKNVLLNKFSKEECMIKAEQFINVENLYWQVIEVVFDDLCNIESKNDAMMEIILKYGFIRVEIGDGNHFICCYGEKDNLTIDIASFKKESRNTIEEMFLGQTISFMNGIIVDDIYSLTLSYDKILQMKEYRYSEGKNVDLYEKDLEKYCNTNHTFNKTIVENLAKLVLLGNVNMIPEYINKLMENLKYLGSNSKVMLTYALSYLFAELGKNSVVSEVFDEYDNLYKELFYLQTLDEAMIMLNKILINISEKIYEKENYSNEQLIKKAIQYIEERYTDASLRFSDVATYVNLSHNYLSTLFREITGESYTDFLIERRMRAAQELIVSTKHRSNEICFMVGYDNPAYFCTTFKKFVGVTISQYRSMVKPQI